ncbi:MAG: DUF3352 domain-containing protein [Candidatus Omnitrophica bacterium]|nr:DUF3352 domain-containing protein [Candidatus Omnitrophota bacterium]
MKRTIIVILIVLVIIGAGVGFFLWRGKALAIEDVLPQGALFYVKFSGVDNNFSAIKSTAFWQSLQTVRWDYLMGKGGFSRHQQELLKSIGEKFADPSTAAVLKEFFGQEFALAFYPPAMDPREITILSDKDMYSFARKMFSNVLLVTRAQGKGIFVDLLARVLRYDAKLQPETEDVEGYTLHYVTLPGTDLRIGFVNIHDLLVIGIDEHILEQSVRTSRREIPAFSSDAHLRRSRERAMVPSEFDGYWNMAEISAYTNEYLGALVSRMEEDSRNTAAPQEQDSSVRNGRSERQEEGNARQNVESIKAWLTERTRLAAGLDVLGVSGRRDDMLAFKFDLYFDRDKVDPQKGATYSCPAATNATLAFIPADAIVYQWNNCLDLKASWDEIKQEVAAAHAGVEDAVTPINALETVLDMNIEEDVLPAFGDEMGGYLKDVRVADRLPSGGSLFPVPEFLFFIKIGDEAKTKELLTRFEDRFLEHVRQEEYNGIPIGYVVSPAGGDIELAYCILDKYLLFSLSRPIIKGAIDTYQNRAPSLAASDAYKAVRLADYPQSRAIQFIRIDEAAAALQNVLTWAKTRQAAQGAQKEAFQKGSAQRLADVAKEMESQKQEFEETKKRIAALNDEIEKLESQQVDAAMQRADLEQSREKAKALEEGITDAQARQKELEEILRGYDRYLVERKNREEIEANVVSPLLKSFMSLKAWGVRTTLETGAFESNVFLKVD